jgi:hypothetical protein
VKGGIFDSVKVRRVTPCVWKVAESRRSIVLGEGREVDWAEKRIGYALIKYFW